jgi:hypothetical protein
MDLLFELYKTPQGQGVQWMPFMMILLKRILDSGFIDVHQAPGGVFIHGLRSNPDTLTLTAKGRAFLDELGVTEL